MPLWVLLNTRRGFPGGSFADRLGAHISSGWRGRRPIAAGEVRGVGYWDFAVGRRRLSSGRRQLGLGIPKWAERTYFGSEAQQQEIDDRIAGESATLLWGEPGWVRLGGC